MTIANLAHVRPGESPARTLARISRAAHNADLEAELFRDLDGLWRTAGWPEPHPQVHFHPLRNFAIDIAFFQPHLLAVEVDGGTWGRRNPRTGEWERGKPGGHTSGAGYQASCEKGNELAIAGWPLLRVTGNDVRSGAALEYIRRALHLPPLVARPDVPWDYQE
jgi:hypothetical protein